MVESVFQGVALEQKGEYKEADKSFKDALVLDNKNVQLVMLYNKFRIVNHLNVEGSRPKVLAGGGAAGSYSYWGLALMSFCDTIFYSNPPPGEPYPQYYLPFYKEAQFSDVIKSLPNGWYPDFVMHFTPEYNFVPLGIKDSPFPTLLIVQDLYHELDHVLTVLNRFDIIGAMDKSAIPFLNIYAPGRVIYAPGNGLNHFMLKTDENLEEIYDVVLLGNIDGSRVDPNYIVRDRIIIQLKELENEYSIFISNNLGDVGEYGPNYARTLSQARIGICCTHTQKIHPALCDIMGTGKLAFVNEGNKAVLEAFVSGEDLVTYNEENFKTLIRHYLSHPEERKKIAQNGRKKVVNGYTFPHQLLRTLNAAKEVVLKKSSFSRPFSVIPSDEETLSSGVSSFYPYTLQLAWRFFNKVALSSAQETKKIADANNNLGVVSMLFSNMETDDNSKEEFLLEAKNYFEEAVTINKNHIIALFNLYQLYLVHLKQDNKILFDSLEELISSGEVFKDNQFPYALIYSIEYQGLTSSSPFFPQSHFRIAWGKLRMRLFAGECDAPAMLGRHLIGRLCYLRGKFFQDKGELEDALSWHEKSKNYDNRDPELYYCMGECAKGLNRVSVSKTAFQQALAYRPLFKEAKDALNSIL